METQTKNLFKFLILPLILAATLSVYYTSHAQSDFLLHVKFYDIGQGDSYMITTYQGNQILVDGGPGKSIVELLSQDMPFYDNTIEMMILTHAHLDHMEGLISVLGKYEVKKILLPHVEYKSDLYDEFLSAVDTEHAEVVYAAQGQRIWLDEATVLDVLYPISQDAAHPKKSDDLNDTSIVAELTFGKTKLLLMGDAGKEIEAELLPKFDLDVDLLKVGHHGSKHSTSPELLLEATPEFAVIQYGKNKYGHPTPETVDLLKKDNIKVFDTFGHNLEFVSDGATIQMR